MTRTRGPVLVGSLTVVLLIVMVTALMVGAGTVTMGQTLRSLGSHLGLPVAAPPILVDSIVWELRVPRVLLAALAGASLAACGCVLQAVTRNALAEPYLLGVSAGASTGAVLVLTVGLGAGALTLSGGALIGGLSAFALVLALAGRSRVSSHRIILTGVVVGQLFAALTSLVVTVWGDADSTRSLTFWLLGSLASARWSSVALCAAVLTVVAGLLLTVAPSLDALAFGEDAAASLGVDLRLIRIVTLTSTALGTAVVVAAVGAIGFVGLVVPHGARLLVGPRHRLLLPVSLVAGAVFLVTADVVGRWIFAPQQVPVGVVTALVGVPVFLVILRRRGQA